MPADNTSGCKTLAADSIVSQQDLENAKAALDVAEAKLEVNQKALDLAIAGPRKEDIGQAEAELRDPMRRSVHSCVRSSPMRNCWPLWMPSFARA